MGRYWYLYPVAVLFFVAGISEFVDGNVGSGFTGFALTGALVWYASRPRRPRASRQAAPVRPTPPMTAVPPMRSAPRVLKSLGKPGIRRVGLTRRPTPYPAGQLVFTVLDIETTGLDPARNGIVEVGVVQVRGDGTVLDEFATLVNSPGSGRDAALVHGIADADLRGAPSWAEVWPELAALIEGTVLVAHNLDFEATFLATQARRIGAVLTDTPALCTLETARRQLDGQAFSLKSLHKTVSGYWRDDEHTALGDARATRDLLVWLLTRAPSPLFLDGPPPTAPMRPVVLPTCPTQSRPVPLENASVANLLRAFPNSPRLRPGDAPAVAQYVAALHESLGDGYLSHDEADNLIALGRRTGLTGPQLRAQHEVAWRQAFEGEETGGASAASALCARWRAAATALGLTELADQLKPAATDTTDPECSTWLGRLRIGLHGDSPAITALRTRARAHGARIAKNITPTVVWLAADDVDASASPLCTARKYGIPVLAAAAAEHLLDAAIAEAEHTSKQRAADARKWEERRAQQRREADAYWRHAWRTIELGADPGPRRVLEPQR